MEDNELGEFFSHLVFRYDNNNYTAQDCIYAEGSGLYLRLNRLKTRWKSSR